MKYKHPISERKRQAGFKHGFNYHPLYAVLRSMKTRCYSPNCNAYHNYGGRGILICDEWKDPATFCKWAIANGWKKGLSIDRINNDGNYEPNNCRFVTREINMRNSRRVVKLMCNDEMISISEIAEKYNINCKTLYTRLSRGWSVERAIKTKE